MGLVYALELTTLSLSCSVVLAAAALQQPMIRSLNNASHPLRLFFLASLRAQADLFRIFPTNKK